VDYNRSLSVEGDVKLLDLSDELHEDEGCRRGPQPLATHGTESGAPDVCDQTELGIEGCVCVEWVVGGEGML